MCGSVMKIYSKRSTSSWLSSMGSLTTREVDNVIKNADFRFQELGVLSIIEGEGDEVPLLRITQEDCESQYADSNVHHVVLHCHGEFLPQIFILSLALRIHTHPPAKTYIFFYVHVHIYRISLYELQSPFLFNVILVSMKRFERGTYILPGNKLRMLYSNTQLMFVFYCTSIYQRVGLNGHSHFVSFADLSLWNCWTFVKMCSVQYVQVLSLQFSSVLLFC